jgi:FkbM family methyltransferase
VKAHFRNVGLEDNMIKTQNTMKLKTISRRAIEMLVSRFGYRLVYNGVYNDRVNDRVIYYAHVNGHPFACVKDTIIANTLLRGGMWDPNMLKLVKHSLANSSSRIIVEAGANIGATMLPIASVLPDVQFEAFEPVPFFFDLLSRNINSLYLKNVAAHNIALSDANDQKLSLDCELGTAGAYMMFGHVIDNVSASTITLDDALAGKDAAFVKIDVDGYEMKVLKGAEMLLRRCQPLVFLEFCLPLIQKMGENPLDELNFLRECGLEWYQVYNDRGKWLEETNSVMRVIELADITAHYVDIVATNSSKRYRGESA